MARNKNDLRPLIEDAELAGGLDNQLNAMVDHSSEIMQRFGDGQLYERDRIIHEARFYMIQSAEAMLEAGKRLIIIKENEPHGDFIAIVTGQLGLPKSTAHRMMQAAFKYFTPSLQAKIPALGCLGKTKLFELMIEDDEVLVELADGGTLAGMTLDDIDRMTSRELKNALREGRENHRAQQRILADKNEKIDALSAQLEKKSRIQSIKPSEELNKLRADVTVIATEAEAAVVYQLANAYRTLTEYCEQHHLDIPTDFMTGLICQIECGIHQVRENFDLASRPEGTGRPEWIDADQPMVNA